MRKLLQGLLPDMFPSGMIAQRGVRLLVLVTVLLGGFLLLVMPVRAQEPLELIHASSTMPPGQQLPLPIVPISITQNVSFDIQIGNSIACGSSQGGYTAQNSFWRVFDLDGEYELTKPITIQSVVFGIETTDGIFEVVVRVYTLAGSFTTENLELISQATIQLDSANSGTLVAVDVPDVTISPMPRDLVIEVDIASGQSQPAVFYPASNALGQSAPTFLSATACGFAQPTDLAAIGYPEMHMVMIVNGDYGFPAAVSLTDFTAHSVTSFPLLTFFGATVALSGAAWYVFRRRASLI